MRRVISQIVVLREGAAEVGDSNHVLKLVESSQGQTQLQVEKPSPFVSLTNPLRGEGYSDVSIREQCQNARLMISPRDDASSAGTLDSSVISSKNEA